MKIIKSSGMNLIFLWFDQASLAIKMIKKIWDEFELFVRNLNIWLLNVSIWKSAMALNYLKKIEPFDNIISGICHNFESWTMKMIKRSPVWIWIIWQSLLISSLRLSPRESPIFLQLGQPTIVEKHKIIWN